MADEQPSLHIDTDWKKQAQEEKRRLAEEEARKKAQTQPAAPPPGVAPEPPGTAAATAAASVGGRGRERGATPEASFASLVQSLLTQILFHLGDLTSRGTEPQINLDLAKYNIDLLGILESRTRGNLSGEEQKLLDSVLYEARMRYVSVASQYATV